MPARTLLIVNPIASRVNPAAERTVVRELESATTIEVARTGHPGHGVELAERAVQEGFDAICVLAGDGTANEVLNGAGDALPIGVLPAGGTSVLARNLGLPPSVPAAARRLAHAIAEGHERRIRVGRLNGRRFAFNAGIGLDAEIVRRVDGRQRTDRGARRSPDAAYARELLRAVARGRYSQPAMTVYVGGQSERVAFVIVGNLAPWTYVGPLPLDLVPTASADGGLDIVAPRRMFRRDVAGFAQRLLIDHRHAHGRGDPRIAYWHDVPLAELRCDHAVPAQVDGDDIGDVLDVLLDIDPVGARYLI